MVKPMAGILMVLALAQAAQATVLPPGLLGAALSLGQSPEPNASAHSVLNLAIDCYRRGEYERAAVLLRRAQASQGELTSDEAGDLNKYLHLNDEALVEREDGGRKVRQAEKALNDGKRPEAASLLKALNANQFLTTSDRQLVQKLNRRLRPGPGALSSGEGPDLGQSGDNTPDQKKAPTSTPAAAAKPDAHALLVSARAALQKGDLDQAELLTAEAEKAAAQARGGLPTWLHPWSDTPAKVRRDIQTARAKEAAALTAKQKAQEKAAADAAAAGKEKPQATEAKASPTAYQAIRGLFVRSSSPTSPAGDTAQPGAKKDDKKENQQAAVPADARDSWTSQPEERPVAPVDKTLAARKLIQEGRKALQAGDLVKARESAEKARDLKPSLSFWEDNPDNLLAAVRRREAQVAKQAAKSEKKTNGPASATAAASADPEKPLTPEEARKLLRQAREHFGKGRLDEAEKLGRLAANVHVRWGLFEDSPEKLRIDLQNTRRKHDQEMSVALLTEARALYAKGDLQEAKKKAYQAQKLHGAYSWWDLGDRPQRLIADIEIAQAKLRNNRPGPESKSLVQNKPAAPTALTAEQRASQAREYLTEARVQLDNKNLQAAQKCVEKVDQLGTEWTPGKKETPPWSDSLSVLKRDIQLASYQAGADAAPPGTPIVSDNAPANGPVRQQVAQDLARQRAKMLVAEARALQAKGWLVEARQKALEAQRTSSAFGPEEDRPEIVLLHLADLCDQRIVLLLKQAEDLVRAGANNPASMRQAETNLRVARDLSIGFGLDTVRVERRIAWLQSVQDSLQAKGPAPLLLDPNALPAQPAQQAGVVKVVGQEGTKGADTRSLKQQGEDMLSKARLELRAGQTHQARHIAEAVFLGPYGMRSEAEAMLRSIDTEEEQQKVLEANKAADAVIGAFNRHDYAHAARIHAAIDPRLLFVARQARLREIMTTPEMQAAAGTGQTPAPAVLAQKDPGQPNLFNMEGKASVSDRDVPRAAPGSEEGPLAQAAAMQDIKFQEVHGESIRVQKEALERFKAGDTDHAVEMLRDFVKNLDETELDQSRVALLKKPVEDRLQKLTMLKAQQEFYTSQKVAKNSANEQMSKLALAEKHKQDQVADLMKAYHTLYKEGKYKEAQAKAQQVLEIDPENVAASAGVSLAQTQDRLKIFHDISKEKEQYDLDALNDTDKTGPSVVVDPLKFDSKVWGNAKKRGGYPNGIPSLVRSQKERDIERRLQAPISLNFKNTPLADVIDTLHDLSGVNVVPDKSALDDASVGMDKPLDLRVENISMKSALNLLLQQLHLTYVVKDEVLVITTEDNSKGKLKRVTYPVADLVIPVENHNLAPAADIQNFFNKSYEAGAMNPYSVSPYPGPYSLQSGTTVSSASTGGYPTPETPPGAAGAKVKITGPGHTIEDMLIKLITSTIAPQTWADVGGQGTVQYFPLGMALIVNQTQDLQEQIADLLAALRKLQDLEVAIEMRMISVSESFFERIGLDFNVNIVNKNFKFDNQLINGQFQPFGFINKFTPNNLVAGYTQAGTLTPDLGIPIQNNSFNLTTPPFGYPGLGGAGDGGLSLGLAFLSDIQVFMFMEAAQGDRRFNIMQAPKLTMFNGQTATLSVADFQFFLTSVSPGFTPTGQLFYIPNNIPVPLGVTLTVQPVVSADRRFVRMTLAPTLTNLTNANVPITLGAQQAGIPQQLGGQQIGGLGQFPTPSVPVQIPVPQVFQGGVVGPNQGGFLQMFLQQPTSTTISINTTVSVPDGGTVLLGGLKTLSEGRSEFGPPLLSKIPYINRLFKNVGYGREAQSLLIMVTPRIIINEEEELRQTGVERTATP
jgi:type II secretory pathway component GspD/PulD (secretin)